MHFQSNHNNEEKKFIFKDGKKYAHRTKKREQHQNLILFNYNIIYDFFLHSVFIPRHRKKKRIQTVYQSEI
jgi:hypothetical protein